MKESAASWDNDVQATLLQRIALPTGVCRLMAIGEVAAPLHKVRWIRARRRRRPRPGRATWGSLESLCSH